MGGSKRILEEQDAAAREALYAIEEAEHQQWQLEEQEEREAQKKLKLKQKEVKG